MVAAGRLLCRRLTHAWAHRPGVVGASQLALVATVFLLFSDGDYTSYLARFVDAWAARGLPLASLTLGNEPQHKPADYPGMWLTASDEVNLVKQLGPALAGKGIDLLTLDHNWALAH